eukprot:33207_1
MKQNKNCSDTTPQDIINVSHYFSIKQLKDGLTTGIALCKESDRMSDWKYFFFKNEVNKQQWFRILLKALKVSNNLKQNSNQYVYNNQVLFLELRINNKLFVYNSNLSNKKKIM